MSTTPIKRATCQADIEAMTQEEARQWLIANDREAAAFWADLPADKDFRAAVRDNCRDFGFDEPQPPSADGQNADRAAWAEYALVAFESQTGADRESSLGDLLTNLMHWADRNGQDFSIALERAKAHYETETGGEAA